MKLRPFVTPALLAAALFAGPALAQPNFEGYWTPSFRAPAEVAELEAKIPPGTTMIDDTGGGELEEGDYGGLTLTPRALAEVAQHSFADELTFEYACTLPSVIYYMQAPFPFEIHQTDELIVMKMEYFDMYRLIHIDGREIPDEAPHSKSGYSVAHWEGEELVVETRLIETATLLNNGFNHSDNIHMIERYKLSNDGSTLMATQVYEDPEVFEGKAGRSLAWRRVPDQYVYPYECDPSFGI